MKSLNVHSDITILFLCLFLCGCITEYEPKGLEEIEGVLVVEGVITDDESVITLSRSKGLSFDDNPFDLSPYHVTDAKVYVECDDGTQWDITSQNSGEYTIKTGKLNPERQYRLKIKLEAHEYLSEFASPMKDRNCHNVYISPMIRKRKIPKTGCPTVVIPYSGNPTSKPTEKHPSACLSAPPTLPVNFRQPLRESPKMANSFLQQHCFM